MNLCLEFLHDSERSPIELKRSVLLIGRHPECDVRINLKSISRRHCCLAQVNDIMIVRDLGSRHGVWVNGQRVDEKVLNEGDEIAIGPMIFKVRAIAFDHDLDQANIPTDCVTEPEDEFEDILLEKKLVDQAASLKSEPDKGSGVHGSIQDTSSNPERSIDQFWQNLEQAESVAPEHFGELDQEDLCNESEIGPGLGLKL